MALIEVLVAFGVFGVGVVGTFSMQVAAKRTNYDAAQQSIATSMTRDILARIRANSDVLDAYVVDDIGAEVLPAVGDCTSISCSNLQLAQHDIYEWSKSLSGERERVVIDGNNIASGGLVDARACIKNEAGIVSVTISWRSFSAAIDASTTPCGERFSGENSSDDKFSTLTMTSFVGRP
jgi:type IV pilus modification protein PilV